MTSESGVVLDLAPWEGGWPADDKDANFKHEVSLYQRLDPLVALRGLSERTGIPVGALARYVLARWTTGASEAVLELGPSTVRRMRDACEAAERDGTDGARLAAYERLRQMVSWTATALEP